jgi:hypothetical protein
MDRRIQRMRGCIQLTAALLALTPARIRAIPQ